MTDEDKARRYVSDPDAVRALVAEFGATREWMHRMALNEAVRVLISMRCDRGAEIVQQLISSYQGR